MEAIQFVATALPNDSLEFYRDIMGFTLTENSPFALAFEHDGAMLRVQKVESLQPHPFTATGWKVDDIAAECAQLAVRGVNFERYDFLQMGDSEVWSAPDGAKICWFKDPDGNVLSLTQFAENK